MATDETLLEENKALVRRMLDRLNDHDLGVIDEVVAADFTPGMGRVGSDEPVVGRDGVRAIYAEYFEAFPDMTAEIEALVAEGKQVAAFMTLRGTHEGSFRSIEPTGKTVEFSTTSLYTIENGQITAGKGQASLMDLVAQLGVEIPLQA